VHFIFINYNRKAIILDIIIIIFSFEMSRTMRINERNAGVDISALSSSLPAVNYAVSDQVTELSPKNIAKAVAKGIIIPPGAKSVYFNRLLCMWFELSTNPEDTPQGVTSEQFVELGADKLKSVDSLKAGQKDESITNATAFSFKVGRLDEFKASRCYLQKIPGFNNTIDGIVFDEASVEAMKEGDQHFHCDTEGNILAMFIMPRGWIVAYRKNRVCHRCGKFPILTTCNRCESAFFCSEFCMLMSFSSTIHNAVVCDEFLRRRVTEAFHNAEVRTILAQKAMDETAPPSPSPAVAQETQPDAVMAETK